MKKPRALRHDVSCEFEGKTYHAQYSIEGGLVTVESLTYGRSQPAKPGPSPEGIAMLLLRELLLYAQSQGRLR